jgi:hypothetical protein
MAGLNLRGGANVSLSPQAFAGSVPNPSSASQAAFGPGVSPASSASALSPTNPAGLATWTGLAGFALLLFIYWSLPG